MLPVRTYLLGLLVIIGLSVLAEPVSAQSTRTIDRTFSLDRDGRVELNTFTGRIEVTGRDRGGVEVNARIEGSNAELVDATGLRFESNDRRLSIEVNYDEVEDSQKFLGLFNIGEVDRPAVHLVISMPRTAALTVDDFSSDIEVKGLRAGLTLETFSSSVVLQDLEGPLDLETFSGAVTGEALRGRVRLETFSGDVRLRIAALTGNSQFETFSGNVELFLPADAGFELVGTEEAFGEFDSEFAFRTEDGRWIVGEGGPHIEVETFNGDLQIRKQQ